MSWRTVCRYDAITADRGVCALLDGHQVAVFRLHSGELFALDNRDPYTGAHVLSRGLVGSRGDEPILVSPMLKQVFALRTGAALDDPAVSVMTYPVRAHDGMVEVSLTPVGVLADAPGP